MQKLIQPDNGIGRNDPGYRYHYGFPVLVGWIVYGRTVCPQAKNKERSVKHE